MFHSFHSHDQIWKEKKKKEIAQLKQSLYVHKKTQKEANEYWLFNLDIILKNEESNFKDKLVRFKHTIKRVTWQIKSPMRVKSADVTALVKTGESERRARYLKQVPIKSNQNVFMLNSKAIIKQSFVSIIS